MEAIYDPHIRVFLLCYSLNSMKALTALLIFHTKIHCEPKNYQGALTFSKNIFSLVHHGVHCSPMMHVPFFFYSSSQIGYCCIPPPRTLRPRLPDYLGGLTQPQGYFYSNSFYTT